MDIYDQFNDFGYSSIGGNGSYLDSAYILHDYQKKSLINGLNADYNYEYDLFPKDFIYSTQFQGRPTNSRATPIDKLNTEYFLTNKIKNIEKSYMGSDEYPEDYMRYLLDSSNSSRLNRYNISSSNSVDKCPCFACKNSQFIDYIKNSSIGEDINTLKFKNDILTYVLFFIILYFIINLFMQKYADMKYNLYTGGTPRDNHTGGTPRDNHTDSQ
jgi:hypothetical protein